MLLLFTLLIQNENLSDELDVLIPGEIVEPPEIVNDETAMQPVDENCSTAQARILSSAVAS